MSLMAKGHSDVPRAWAAALEQVLAAVDPTGRVTEFVLTGQPADGLKALKGDHMWARRTFLRNTSAGDKPLVTLYGGFGDVDPAVLRRWGRVLDESWGTSGMGLTLGDLAGCHWPELLVQQAAACFPSGQLPVTFADLERIAAEDDTTAADLVRMAFTLVPYHRYAGQGAREQLPRLPGFADAVAAHRDIPAATLMSGSVDERVSATSLLTELGEEVLVALAEPLAQAATSTSAQVRAAIRPLIDRIGDAAVHPLRVLAAGGEPGRRACALELLAARPDQRAWAAKTADADRAASVRALSARWAAAGPPPAEAEEEALPELPLLPS